MKFLIQKIHDIKTSYKLSLIITLITFIWIFSGIVFKAPDNYDTRTVAEKMQERTEKLQTVRVKKISAQNMMQSISLSGKTESLRTVELKTETSGRVKSIDFKEGTTAKEGTTIISLEIDNRKSLVDRTQANLKEKEIAYKAKIKLQEKELTSISAVAKAESELKLAKSQHEIAKLNYEHTQVKAPFNGIVEDIYVEVGDFVSIGQPIAKIVDLDMIKAVGYLSENLRSSVKTGTEALVSFPNGQTLEGKITYISSSSDNPTRTYKFEISMPNKKKAITEGLTCTIKLQVATRIAHSILPSLLVLNDEGKIGIRTIGKNNIVEFHEVEILTDESEQIWLSGLPEEFTLITVGQEYVKQGSKVIPLYEEEEKDLK